MLFLSGEISTGVPFGKVAVVRPLPAVERSPEAVVPAGIGRWCREGPNVEPGRRTPVLVGVAMIAATRVRGLGGKAGG